MTLEMLLVDSTLRISVVLAGALASLWLLRHRSAALRRWVLAGAVVGAVLAPLASPALPSWDVGALWPDPGAATVRGTDAGTTDGSGSPSTRVAFAADRDARRAAAAATAESWPAWQTLVVGAWATGATVSLLFLAAGLVRLRWVSARTQPMTSPNWTGPAREIAAEYGVRRDFRILRSLDRTMIVAWGVFRRRVIVPADADRWPDERIRIVLAHELAHVARGDWAFQMLAEVLRAIYWFNPLTWLAARQLREECERASDDAVLGVGVDGCSYASHLIDLARELGGARRVLPAPAMAEPSGLERRVTAMLNTTLDRSRPSVLARAAGIVALFVLTVVVASAQTTAPALSGVVVDETGLPMPGVRITLEDSNDEYDVDSATTDLDGRFRFESLPHAGYNASYERTGFKKVLRTGITVGPVPIDMGTTTMEIGGLTEAVEINVAGALNEPSTIGERPEDLEAVQLAAIGRCGAASVGGHVSEPRKIRDVKPWYPAQLVGSGITGLVILEGRINEYGRMEDVRVLREVHPDLDAAAAEAVSLWRYTPVLLNCEPIPVIATVTVNFAK